MNREQAEKLLAALIFNELDEASKAELTAYLQTDAELRYRLADLRMVVKLTDDAVNEGPDPVLGERRLKQLKRLARTDKVRVRVFRVRVLAAAAVFIFAVAAGTFMPVVKNFGGRIDRGRVSAYRIPALSTPVAQPPTSSPAPSEPTVAAGDHYTGATPQDGAISVSGGGVFANRRYSMNGRGGMGGSGGAGGTGGGDGMMGGMGGYGGGRGLGMGSGGISNSTIASNGDSGTVASLSVSDGPVPTMTAPPATPPSGGPAFSFGRRDSASVSIIRGAKVERDELEVAKDSDGESILGGGQFGREGEGKEKHELYFSSDRSGESARAQRDEAGKPLQMMMPQKQTARGRGNEPAQSVASSSPGVEQSQRTTREKLAEVQGQLRELHQDASGSDRRVAANAPAIVNGAVPYGWRGEITPQKPGMVFAGAPSGSGTAADDKKLDQPSTVYSAGTKAPMLGDVPLTGQIFQKQLESEGVVRIDGVAKQPADKSSAEAIKGAVNLDVVFDPSKPPVPMSGKPVELNTRLEDFAARTVTDANITSNGKANLDVRVVEENKADLPSSSRFKVVPVNPWVLTDRDAQSTFALDVDTASYALCRRYIRNGNLPPVGAVRMEEFINAFDYAYPQRSDQTFTVYAEGAPSPFAAPGQNLTLLKLAVKARTAGRDQQRTSNLVLVIDASASMGQPDRLPAVQAAANQLVDRLAPTDRVSLVTCARDARLHLEAVPAEQKDLIHQTINSIQPAGQTNLSAGLKLGYAMARKAFVAGRNNQVVLCSDGVANVGQTEAEALLQEVAQDRKQAITLTCVGVGYGAYNDAFLEALANQGDGQYLFLDTSAPAQQALVGQLAASMQNVAGDARIQVQFNPARVRRYRLIGYENRDIEDKRFRDDTIEAGAVGSGQCSTALYELELTSPSAGAGAADLGTVFVRYRNTETGQMEEVSRTLAGSIIQRRAVEQNPRFFLAAGAARFAEWLRQSEHAQQTSLADVQNMLDQVSAALPLDQDVKDLAALAHQAEGLPRAPEPDTAPQTRP